MYKQDLLEINLSEQPKREDNLCPKEAYNMIEDK